MKKKSDNEIFQQATKRHIRHLFSKTDIVQRNIYVSNNKITVDWGYKQRAGLGGCAWRVLAACLCVHAALADLYQTSWHVYQEEQCCVAEGPNKQGNKHYC